MLIKVIQWIDLFLLQILACDFFISLIGIPNCPSLQCKHVSKQQNCPSISTADIQFIFWAILIKSVCKQNLIFSLSKDTILFYVQLLVFVPHHFKSCHYFNDEQQFSTFSKLTVLWYFSNQLYSELCHISKQSHLKEKKDTCQFDEQTIKFEVVFHKKFISSKHFNT